MSEAVPMSRRKILLYLPALLGGGAERVFALLASEFARRGHEIIFAFDHMAQENAAFIDPAVRLVDFSAGHLGATLKLAALMRREKPDVSLSGMGVANLKHMIAATLAGRLRHVVLSFHAFFVTENTALLSTLGNRLTPLFTRLAPRSVAVSDSLRRYLIEEGGASEARVQRIYNPVMAAGGAALPDAVTLAARDPVVLYLGRFHPDKDVGTLLRAFAQVNTPGARLVLAGDSAERPGYEAMAREMGLAERVHFAGYQKDPGMVLASARAFVCSSVWESFGNVVAEALAYGLPVVTTASAGPVEIVDHGRFGAIVPVGDATAMARAIEAALANPGDPAPRMARAREFSVEAAADQYLALFDEVIAQARG